MTNAEWLEANGLPNPNPPAKCIYRGEVVRKVVCPTCTGNIGIKIYACPLHKECSLGLVEGVASCSTCNDRCQ